MREGVVKLSSASFNEECDEEGEERVQGHGKSGRRNASACCFHAVSSVSIKLLWAGSPGSSAPHINRSLGAIMSAGAPCRIAPFKKNASFSADA